MEIKEAIKQLKKALENSSLLYHSNMLNHNGKEYYLEISQREHKEKLE